VASPSRYSQLHLLRGSDPAALPTRFAWLAGNVLLHGHLLLQQLADDAAVADGSEYVADMRQLQLGPRDSGPEDEPRALVSAAGVVMRVCGLWTAACWRQHPALMACTDCCTKQQACSEYHYLLLYADKLAALNQVSGKVVNEAAWGPGSHAGSIVGACRCCAAARGRLSPRWPATLLAAN
jgi:hypothetical protein